MSEGGGREEVGTHARHSLAHSLSLWCSDSRQPRGRTDERTVRETTVKCDFSTHGAMAGWRGRERVREGGKRGRLKGGPSFCSSRVSHAMTQTAQGTKEEPGEKCKWKRYVYRGQESSKLAPWYAQVLLAEKKIAQCCTIMQRVDGITTTT